MPRIRSNRVRSTARQRHGGDGHQIGNAILLSLPPGEFAALMPLMELMRLKLHQLFQEAGEAIKSCYFLNDGLASVLTVQPDGRSVEVGLVGREGFVGLPVIFGFRTSALRVMTQGEGTAYRINTDSLLGLLPSCPRLNRLLQQFSMILAMQSTQIAACNRLHEVDERLARWLMMSHDRIGTDKLPLTQEFLGQMLGIRRASVSVAAGILQKAGMISYIRGHVTIKNKAKLEGAACDCYGIIQKQKRNWLLETQ